MTSLPTARVGYDRAAPLRAVETCAVERTSDGLRLTATLPIAAGEATTRGHFPGLPILPGVFVVEAATQAMAATLDRPGSPPTVLRRLRSIRFLGPFLDGDELTLRLTATRLPSGWSVEAEGVRADGFVAARLRAEYGSVEADDA